jgi:acyl dehydratase
MGMTYFEDLSVGDNWTSSEHTVDHEEMLAYGRANDPWPFHADPKAAARSPYGGLIASGGYTITLMYRLGHEIINQPNRRWAFLGGFDWHLKFAQPVRAGDRLRERITILEMRASSKPGRGIFKNLIELINDRGSVVLSIESIAMMATRSIGLVDITHQNARRVRPDLVRFPRFYGISEIVVGYYLYNQLLPRAQDRWAVSISIAGAVYIIVRGYDNWYGGMARKKWWNWVFFGNNTEGKLGG